MRNFILEFQRPSEVDESVVTEETEIRKVVRNASGFRIAPLRTKRKFANCFPKQSKFWPKRHKWSIINDAETVAKRNKS